MYYTIYKITNILNGKIYVGSHKTNELDDNYMGSGVYLKKAQNKYGIENFKKEILFVFGTAEEMYAKEADIVNEDFLATENAYNIKLGGFGGWDHVNSNWSKYHSTESMKAMSAAGAAGRAKALSVLRADPEWSKNFANKAAESQRKYVASEGYVNSFKDKKHTDDAKRRIAAAAKENQSGEKNSQYGRKKSDEQIAKMKATIAAKPPVVCPHCGKESNNKSSMMRWHFDRCAYNEINILASLKD